MELSPDQIRLTEIFHPFAFERQANVKADGTRFVHYTHADAAMNILRTKEFWMRKTSCMDDFMEVQHGLECLLAAYRGKHGDKFKLALEGMFPHICDEIEHLFNGWVPHLQIDTYITCVSEHSDAEDTFGRLSMWRTYKNAPGIAVVMNNKAFLSPSVALKAYTSPVAYLTNEAFEQELGKLANSLESESDFLKGQDRQAVVSHVFNAFKFAILCTKHPGFQEEREWRVIYSPRLEKSKYLAKDIQVFGGIPQPIYKIPLKDIPEEDFVGVEIPKLVDRIIIGPTQYPSAAREAFEYLLENAGVDNPENRVVVSDIPLR